MKDLGVIYANEHNIWDEESHGFCFGKNFDELSYAMPLEEAEGVLEELKKEGFPDAYLVVIPGEIPAYS